MIGRGHRVILLTAAVTPDPRLTGVLVDPRTRSAQYKRAIMAWQEAAAKVSAELVVVETSGASPDDILDTLDGTTWISFSPSDRGVLRGKGAAEAEALDHAIGMLGARIVGTSTLHKATGRLILENPGAVLGDVCRTEFRVRRSLDRSYCDTRLISCSLDGWATYLTGMATEVDDQGGRYLEHVLAQRLIMAEYGGGASVSRFRVRPSIRGVSGQTGQSYGGQWRARAVAPLERMLAHVASRKEL